ncbi:hypothetical protein HDK77DRAFT_318554 [Phyllosticta capitalensis]|uniref:Uncharacterized protein n=1 Tax=Phyllosticta capitalensis TaxID=121624 RepID=A0ABR1YJP1_9PEZI
MSDYGYDSDEFELVDDDAWLYIAEDDQLADDLAEGAIPDPPFLDNQLDNLDGDDYYEYWIDIEYNSDGWNDVHGKPKIGQSTAPGNKRKKGTQGGPPQKKIKVSQDATGSVAVNSLDAPPVRWISLEQRMDKVLGLNLPLAEPQESFALLQDWRTRFVPAAASKASVDEEEGDWATDSEGESRPPLDADAGGGDDAMELLAGSGLDPQALMRALQENLSVAGGAPAGLDQNTLLKYALRMLNGEGQADDIAGDMADDLFEQVDEDSDGNEIAEWVSKQKNGQADVAATDDAEHGSSQSKNVELPPTPPTAAQCAAEDASASKKTRTAAGNAATAGPSGSRKRKAEDAAPDSAPPPTKPKRAAGRSYAAATASSKAKSNGKGKK